MAKLTPQSIALAQINCKVGDIAGNVQRISDAYEQSARAGVQLVVFPELTVCGYPPEDLVLRPAFREESRKAVEALAKLTAASGCAMIVGGIHEEDGKIYNAAFALSGGKIAHIQPKVKLPNYGVFDEKRLFTRGPMPDVFQLGDTKIGVLVCEDMWPVDVPRHLQAQGAHIMIVINASPYEEGKHERRLKNARRIVGESGVPFVYANLVGGQDDLLFDGSSFILDAQGALVVQLQAFEECVACERTGCIAEPMSREESIYGALVLGLRDYVRKNGFEGVLLGLSGGIDSALVAAIAVDALGPQNVKGVLLPSPYNSQASTDDALETAKLLGIEAVTVPITSSMKAAAEALAPVLGDSNAWMENVSVGGNVQARLRGLLLMAISNQSGRMLLSTSNKSEVSVGYSTLYGDMCGGFAPIRDVYKTTVYAIAHWRNSKGRVIPERAITKAPTAELKPGQRDDDQLPPYETLDPILERLIEKRESVEQIIAAGFARDVVTKVEWLLRVSEYKRRQAAPGTKVSAMVFGKDRRFPLTNGFKA